MPQPNHDPNHRGGARYLALCGLVVCLVFICPVPQWAQVPSTTRMQGALVSTGQATADRLISLKGNGFNAVALELREGSATSAREAARRITGSGLDLYFWIEVGRNPAMADAHPEWMASLQGHPEWRRYFPNAPQPKTGEVVKNYPWAPVLYKESFEAHVNRVAGLLKGLPTPKGIFLNDLQAAPSACGCGNILCRWETDYGPIKTATRLPADAAARFVEAVQKLSPKASVIPVWTTECQEHERESKCAGIGCFTGACWREYTSQLMPVAERCETLAAFLPYKLFGQEPGWVKSALESFREMPPKRNGRAIPANRVIAVLQGWDVTAEEWDAQVGCAREAGAAGYIMSFVKLDQSWEPRIVKATRTTGTVGPPPHSHP